LLICICVGFLDVPRAYLLCAYHLFIHSKHDCCTRSLLIQHRSHLTYHKDDILLLTKTDLVKQKKKHAIRKTFKIVD